MMLNFSVTKIDNGYLVVLPAGLGAYPAPPTQGKALYCATREDAGKIVAAFIGDAVFESAPTAQYQGQNVDPSMVYAKAQYGQGQNSSPLGRAIGQIG